MAKLSLTDITTGYFSAAAYNANNALIEAALENTLSRDGTTPNTLSAALDMNSNKINNLADGTNNQDAVTVSQLNSAVLGGGAVGYLQNIVEDLTPQLGGVLDSNDFGIDFTSASYLFTMEADETNGWLTINADTPWTNEWGLNLAVGGWFSMQSGADVYTTLETTPILGDTLYNQLLYNSTNGTGYLAEFSYNGDTFLQLGSYVQDAPMGFYVTQGSSTGYKYPMVFDAENGYTYFGQFPVRIGNLGNTWENVSAPFNLTAPINYPTAFVEWGHDGTDFNVTGTNTTDMNLSGLTYFTSATANAAAIRIAAGALGTPAYAFVGDLDTGMQSTTTDSLSLICGGVEALIFSESAGNISGELFGGLQIDDNILLSFGSGGDVTIGYENAGNDFVIDATPLTAEVHIDLDTLASFRVKEDGTDVFHIDLINDDTHLYGHNFRIWDATDTDFIDIVHDGTNTVFSTNAGGYFFEDGNVLIRDGSIFAIYDATNVDNVAFSHDGTDFNIAGTTTTDINITGVTAIQAGTVDADFDAVTATSYGGITEANLLDKSAAETITGAYVMSTSLNAVPLARSISATETTASTDYGIIITLTGGVAQELTLDSDPPINSVVMVDNQSGNSWTIACATATNLIWAKDATTGDRTLADDGLAVCLHRGSGVWIINGSALLT